MKMDSLCTINMISVEILILKYILNKRGEVMWLQNGRVPFYQIIVILEGVVQGGDPLAVSVYQHVSLLPKTRSLEEDMTLDDPEKQT